MDNEETNKEIAAILHAGFPKMVQKIYSLAKFEKFFWEKRELLHQHIANRFAAIDEKPPKRQVNIHVGRETLPRFYSDIDHHKGSLKTCFTVFRLPQPHT